MSTMKRTAAAIVCACALGAVAAPSHLGVWEVVEDKSYIRVVLKPDGSCLFLAGSIIGDKRDGIGGRCRYLAKGGKISIIEMRGLDGSGPIEKVNPPMRLRYDSRADSLSILNESSLRLSRAQKGPA